MGGCLSENLYELPDNFIITNVSDITKCNMCKKQIKQKVVICTKCNNLLGHIYCSKKWISIIQNCPNCKN